MSGTLLIRNGNVADVINNQFYKADIEICGNKITRIQHTIEEEADVVLDASDCYVIPGLIDYHVHLFKAASDHGVNPDSALLPNGVTTAVDAGTSVLT